MFIVIGGIGTVGRYLLDSFLIKSDISITLIENNPDKARDLKNDYDVLLVEGNMMSHYILRQAGVASCDLFIACSRIDAENIVACQLSKRMGAKQCVARIYSEDIFPYEEGELEALFNVDWIFSPNRLAGYLLAHSTLNSDQIQFDNYFSSRLDLARLRITPKSYLLKKKATDIFSSNQVAVIGIYTKNYGSIILQNEKNLNYTLQEGDEIIIAGTKQRLLYSSSQLFLKENTYSHKLYLAGSGKTVMSILSLMEFHKKYITLLEKNLHTCEIIEKRFQINVFHIDPNNYNDLQEIQLHPNASFVCGSENDAENLTYALNAKDLGLKNIFPLIYNKNYERIFSRLGFNTRLSPAELGAKEIFRYFNQILDTDFELIKGSKARGITKGIEPNSSLIGENIQTFFDPKYAPFDLAKIELINIAVVAIWRRGKILFPQNTKKVEVKDKILICCFEGNTNSLKTILNHQ